IKCASPGHMSIERRVRDIYARLPYPPPSSRMRPTWTLPALKWIDALRENPEGLDPSRILVAGCGVGTEAFTLARRFPRAEIVAVDFSERSIRTAKKMRREAKLDGRVRFEVADLSSRNLIRTTGDDFDLVTCHGVLSYIPDVVAVLRNFKRALSPSGTLVLGVNGASHPSVRSRRMLPLFGISPEEFEDGDRVRDVLRIFDCLIEYPRLPMADREAVLLAGDIFGPLNHSLPLGEWSAFLDRAHLHLLGGYHAFFANRALFNYDLHLRIMPRSRREMTELTDTLQPASFHSLIVSRRAPSSVPWLEPRRIFEWRPLRTRLYRVRWPHGKSAPQNLRTVTLTSASTRTRVELRVPQWNIEILRQADGKQTVREIIAPLKARIAPKAVAEATYLLYQLAAMNLLPPESS
ncbi:MAG TPA: class I SAM-dependent methyltransferase, partial [Thermoanaerobaculia bacterium]